MKNLSIILLLAIFLGTACGDTTPTSWEPRYESDCGDVVAEYVVVFDRAGDVSDAFETSGMDVMLEETPDGWDIRLQVGEDYEVCRVDQPLEFFREGEYVRFSKMYYEGVDSLRPRAIFHLVQP